AYLADIYGGTAVHLMRVGHRLAAALRATDLLCEGVHLFLADGEEAMQDVFHVHLHVIPRFPGDGFGLVLPPNYRDRPPRDELEDAATRIRAALVASDPS